MRRLENWRSPLRITGAIAVLGMILTALIAAPLVAVANGADNATPHPPPRSVAICQDRADRTRPIEQRFIDELVIDQVISDEQAAEITTRLQDRRFQTCIERLLFVRGTASEAAAGITGTSRREVLGALVAGQSLAEYAAQHGVDEASLIAAIMAGPAAAAAELVAAGEIGQEVADDVLGSLETKVAGMIQISDIKLRHFHDAGRVR